MSLNIRDQTSLAVQWLTLHVPSAGGTNLILVLGIKILYASHCGQNNIKGQIFIKILHHQRLKPENVYILEESFINHPV